MEERVAPPLQYGLSGYVLVPQHRPPLRKPEEHDVVAALLVALEGLLLSADAVWETDGSVGGHDWKDACDAARAALALAKGTP